MTLAVILPNGSRLEPGSRVRVPKELLDDPRVQVYQLRYGWQVESPSPGSAVLRWPETIDR
jgi:hypothetical protein